MRVRFLHMADCHLGYRQYNLRERFNDFGRAFHEVIQIAIAEKVDFVLLAGDLFHKRAIDALTLNQAIAALERLKSANIPCIAVEGNHEHAYVDDFIGWMKFLALRQYVILLDAEFKEGVPQLAPYAKREGSYVDPVPGVRVHGMRYFGAGTKLAVARYAEAMAALPRDGVEYAIYMTHAGLEGEVAEQVTAMSMADWSPLRPHADYVALGHIHKPYSREEWIYNPGSLETCAADESNWRERGYYLVEVDTATEGPKHRATLHSNRRRPFVRMSLKTDLIQSPELLYAQARSLMERRARDLGPRRGDAVDRPVVDLYLHGVLPFARSDLAIENLEQALREVFDPLHVSVRNGTRSNDILVEPGQTHNRQSLERQVLADLFRRDPRFAPHSQSWARMALGIKSLVLDGAGAEVILAELTERMAHLETDSAAPQEMTTRGDDDDAEGDHADPLG